MGGPDPRAVLFCSVPFPLSVSAPAPAESVPVVEAVVESKEDGGVEELNPDGTKKLSKSQLKKAAKQAELAAKKAEAAAKRAVAEQGADAERIEKAKAIKITEDKSLPVAKRVRTQKQTRAHTETRHAIREEHTCLLHRDHVTHDLLHPRVPLLLCVCPDRDCRCSR